MLQFSVEHVDNGGPLLWRAPFPDKVQAQLVTKQNPKGRITNSDLELAGTIMHQDVLANHKSDA